jgi:hypothetical protein
MKHIARNIYFTTWLVLIACRLTGFDYFGDQLLYMWADISGQSGSLTDLDPQHSPHPTLSAGPGSD